MYKAFNTSVTSHTNTCSTQATGLLEILGDVKYPDYLPAESKDVLLLYCGE